MHWWGFIVIRLTFPYHLALLFLYESNINWRLQRWRNIFGVLTFSLLFNWLLILFPLLWFALLIDDVWLVGLRNIHGFVFGSQPTFLFVRILLSSLTIILVTVCSVRLRYHRLTRLDCIVGNLHSANWRRLGTLLSHLEIIRADLRLILFALATLFYLFFDPRIVQIIWILHAHIPQAALIWVLVSIWVKNIRHLRSCLLRHQRGECSGHLMHFIICWKEVLANQAIRLQLLRLVLAQFGWPKTKNLICKNWFLAYNACTNFRQRYPLFVM